MKIYRSYLSEYTKRIIGYSPLAIIGQSCLGSAAAMFILMNGSSMFQMSQLFMVTILCMLYNGAILSQQSPKTSFNLLISSTISSFLLILLNLF